MSSWTSFTIYKLKDKNQEFQRQQSNKSSMAIISKGPMRLYELHFQEACHGCPLSSKDLVSLGLLKNENYCEIVSTLQADFGILQDSTNIYYFYFNVFPLKK